MSSTLDELGSDGGGDRIETSGGWPDGINYKFPRRDLGAFRWVAWVAVILLVAVVCWLVQEPVTRFFRHGVMIGSIAAGLTCSVLLVPICRYPLWYSLFLLFGHAEIEIRADSIAVGERVAFLRFTRRWPLFRIRQVQIFDALPSSSQAPSVRTQLRSGALVSDDSSTETPVAAASPFLSHLHALTAVLDDGQRIVLTLAYPKPLLEGFSRELFEQMAIALKQRAGPGTDGPFAPRRAALDPELTAAARQTFGAPNAAEPAGVALAETIGLSGLIAEAQEKIRKRIEPDVFEQPVGSTVEVQSFPDGVTLRVPPAGVWKTGGIFQIGLIFTIVTAGFTTLFAGAGVAQGGRGAVGAAAMAIAMMSLFWIAGLAVLYLGWLMGTRQTVVAVVGESVMVMQTGLRRAKRREWPKSQIKTARVGPSGTEINDRPLLELQLLGADDKKLLGMLAGRDVRELQWMATLLRQAIGTNEPAAPNESPSPAPTESAGSSERTADLNFAGMTIEERLQVAGLSQEFSDAAGRDDRQAMIALLERVQLPSSGAAAFLDDFLAQTREPQN